MEYPKKEGTLGKVYSTPWLHYDAGCLGYTSEDQTIYLCYSELNKVFILPDISDKIKIKVFNRQKRNSTEVVRLNSWDFTTNGLVFKLDNPASSILIRLLNTYGRVWVKIAIKEL